MNTPRGYAEIIQTFGNPFKADLTVDEVWTRKNIATVKPPPDWKLYYQQDAGIVRVSGMQLHRALHDSFTLVMTDIWNHAAAELGAAATTQSIQTWLHASRLDLYGGSYNPRLKRGGNAPSLHSWGIAIDWDPLNNPRKKPLTRTLPNWWYDIWALHGWSDGRAWKTPDPMHVQFATGA